MVVFRMLSLAVKLPVTDAGRNDVDAEWISEVASIIDSVEHADTPQRLINSLVKFLPFDYAICVANRRDRAPLYFCDTFKEDGAKAAVQRYLKGTYLLNPVYNAFLAGMGPGVRRMRDLAPDNWGTTGPFEAFEAHARPDEEIGFQTFGWPSGLEELVITFDLPEGALGEISLSYPAKKGGFSDENIGKLIKAVPLIGAVFRRHWPHATAAGDGGVETLLTPLLKDFGQEVLSPREAQVVQMILKGHSGQSISLSLEISETTVKTHRQNAYAKLEVATHQQLFARFLEWLASKKMLVC